ncbi:hypothetical protein DPEC_G00268130 [Dallia pectoralis]|uniref:Uncharacterized protein n=1 Tax=Dallia pectoralis TaxID=75939 RepID=A0ACC2FNS9_DALPE|nr:hypothetical protein DPEC_G00268130 [Dallia pectoralis]
MAIWDSAAMTHWCSCFVFHLRAQRWLSFYRAISSMPPNQDPLSTGGRMSIPGAGAQAVWAIVIHHGVRRWQLLFKPRDKNKRCVGDSVQKCLVQ